MVDSSQRPELAAGLTYVGGYSAIPWFLEEFGCELIDILAQAGLAPDVFDYPDNIISAADLSRLFTTCVVETQCPHAGLLVGQKSKLISLAMLEELIQCSATVGESLDAFMRYYPLQDRTAGVEIKAQGSVAILSFAVYAEVEHADAICDAALALFTKILRAMCGESWAPSEVLLPRYRPVDPRPYHDFFKSPLRFEEETAALVFDRKWLAQPLGGANRVLIHALDTRIVAMQARDPAALKDELRRVLRLELLRGKSSAEEIAGLFEMHHRTFHRRLRGEGTTLRTISNEIRLEIAHQLLADTHIPLSRIAAALAFSEASAFTRAFRRWTGETPSAHRTAHHSRAVRF